MDGVLVVAGALVMAWFVVSSVVALVVGLGIHRADEDRRRRLRSEASELP